MHILFCRYYCDNHGNHSFNVFFLKPSVYKETKPSKCDILFFFLLVDLKVIFKNTLIWHTDILPLNVDNILSKKDSPPFTGYK